MAWDLPPGHVHDQHVLNHPAGHISIGTLDETGVPLHPPRGRVYGVLTGTSVRRLTVSGWTVAARTSVGGLGAFLDRPARGTSDTRLAMSDALPGLDADTLVDAVASRPDNAARIEVLRDALERLVAVRDPALVAEAR